MPKDEFFVCRNLSDYEWNENLLVQEGRKYNREHGIPFRPEVEFVWNRSYCPHCRSLLSLSGIGTASMFYFNEYCAIIFYPLCVKCTTKLIRYQQSDHKEGAFSETTEKALIRVFLEWYRTIKK